MKLKFLLLSLILCANTLLSSIISGTLITTFNGYKTVENIAVGDIVIGYDHGSPSSSTITHIRTTITDTLIAITTNKGTFNAAPDQQFFDPVLEQWIAAKNLTILNTFLDTQLNHCACLHVENMHIEPISTYHISTTTPHNFFITEQELLTHNAIPIIIGIAWLFGEGLKFAGITIGTALLGSYVGVQLYNAQKQKAEMCNASIHAVPCGNPCPDPDDDNDNDNGNLLESIKLNANKKMRHKRFGNFYRDPKTKLWWSKDNADHGGSAFKVFKETSKGLKWIFDADALGNQIIGKHKGPIGIFIPYKELIRCP